MRILINAAAATFGGPLSTLGPLLATLPLVDEGRHTYGVVARSDIAEKIDPHHERVKIWSRWPGTSRRQRILQEQILLPLKAMTTSPVDAVFSISSPGVMACPVPQAMMFQNAAPFTPAVIRQHGRSLSGLRLRTLRRLSQAAAHVVDRAIFISDSQRDTILPQLPLQPSKAARVYLSFPRSFRPEAAEKAGEVLPRYGLTAPYIVCVSHFYRYKNLLELAEAFALALPRLPGDVVLAFAGAEVDKLYAQELRAVVAAYGMGKRIRLLGSVPPADLPTLQAASAAFVFPSVCESYPTTLVEGLATGAPTLTSRLGPMDELAGDGALYFDPYSPPDIAEKLVQVFTDQRLRQDLGRRGIRRAATFSWERTARETLKVIEGMV